MLKTRVVILAAGKGKRMGSDIPKTLIRVDGRPMLFRILESVKESCVDEKPIVVIGHGCEKIIEVVRDNVQFVMQDEQLGTGHAVRIAKQEVFGVDKILVLYGDHPFITGKMIKELSILSLGETTPITMATTKLQDFEDWRSAFFNFGRIIRNDKNEIIGIKERKDANDTELEIKEVNPGFYCFESNWLWSNIDKLSKNNAQGEYYLTDLVELACRGGKNICSIEISPEESIGVNKSEELALAEEISKIREF